jgi:hypothetical protein
MAGRALLALVAASFTLATGCASARKMVTVTEISSVSVVRLDTREDARFQVFFEVAYEDSSSRSLTAKLVRGAEPVAETGDGPPEGADHLAVAIVSSGTRARPEEKAPGRAAFVEIRGGPANRWVLVDIPPETEHYWVQVPPIPVPDDDASSDERSTSVGESVRVLFGTVGLVILVIATAPISIPILIYFATRKSEPGRVF